MVFGIGLGKTGTTSLAMAMSQLGYLVKHAPSYVDEIKKCEFANDIAVAWRFRFLDHVFPHAKFILTVRDKAAWLTSWRTHLVRNQGNGLLRRLENRFMCFGRTDFDEKAFAAAYDHHVSDVLHHFRERPEKLLVVDVCTGQGWDTLCPFLGVPIPASAFPHRNKRTRRKLERQREFTDGKEPMIATDRR